MAKSKTICLGCYMGTSDYTLQSYLVPSHLLNQKATYSVNKENVSVFDSKWLERKENSSFAYGESGARLQMEVVRLAGTAAKDTYPAWRLRTQEGRSSVWRKTPPPGNTPGCTRRAGRGCRCTPDAPVASPCRRRCSTGRSRPSATAPRSGGPGRAHTTVRASAVQCCWTAVPGGHWSHRCTSEVTGSRCWYFGGGTSWNAQVKEMANSCAGGRKGWGRTGGRGWGVWTCDWISPNVAVPTAQRGSSHQETACGPDVTDSITKQFSLWTSPHLPPTQLP